MPSNQKDKQSDKVLKVVPKPEKIDVECIIINGCNECIDRSTADGHNQALDQYDSFIKTNLPSVEEIQLAFCLNCIMLKEEQPCKKCSQKAILKYFKAIDKLYRQRLKVD